MTKDPLPFQAPLDPALVDAARADVLSTRNGSTSRLAHALRTSWRVAERVMDELEAEGIVSAADDDGRRVVLGRRA